MKQYALYVGRFQPWHQGHDWLIRQKLDKGIPVLVAVRDCPKGPSNPTSAVMIAISLRDTYKDEDVKVIVIPDIESINWGRTVGYEVNHHIPPQEIGEISATKIREAQNG